jgi:hypothetical protein
MAEFFAEGNVEKGQPLVIRFQPGFPIVKLHRLRPSLALGKIRAIPTFLRA